MSNLITKLLKKQSKLFAPPPDLKVSEWADAERRLSSESSAEPGRWRTDRAPYQKDILDAVNDHKTQKVVVMSSAQVGKALAIDTPIRVVGGWKVMGDIKVGDYVYSPNGSPVKVTFTTNIMYNRDCFSVEFSDGKKLVADRDHQWAVCDDLGLHKKHKVLTTGELLKNYKQKNRNRYAIEICRPIQTEKVYLPIDPYFVGAWLGDGHSYSAKITIGKQDINFMVSELKKSEPGFIVRRAGDNFEAAYLRSKEYCTRGHNYKKTGKTKKGYCAECSRQFSKAHQHKHLNHKIDAITNPTMFNRLTSIGVIKNKHIPEIYLNANIDQRFSLLQGLMDTDGSITKKGRCEYVTTSKQIAKGFGELLSSLGIKYTVYDKQPKTKYKGEVVLGKKAKRFSFLVYKDKPVFRMPRKLNRIPSRKGRRTTETERRRIINIKPVPSTPVKCIQVDSKDHLYLAGKDLIPTHNTELLLNLIGYYVHHDPSPILLLQPTVEMAQAFSKDRLSPMCRDTPALKGRISDSKSRSSGNTILHKPLDIETPIPTSNGWKKMGDIDVGDVVFDENGIPTKVYYVTPVQYDKNCYKITFCDGSEIISDENHPWYVEFWRVDKKFEKPKQKIVGDVKTTKELFDSNFVLSKGRLKYSIPVCKPLDCKDKKLSIAPYTLGVWLGDGNSHNTKIASDKKDANETASYIISDGYTAPVKHIENKASVIYVDKQESAPRKKDELGRFAKATSGLRYEMECLDLLSKAGDGKSRKHIPEIYLRSSIQQRLSLLQGLMDSDGSCRKKDGLCIYTTILKNLSDGVYELICSLGLKAKVTILNPKNTSTGRYGKKAYRIEFTAPESLPVFRLKRKLVNQRKSVTIKSTRRTIKNIEKVDSVPVRCIGVESENHLFLAGKSMIPTHNTFAGGHITMAGANSPASLASRPIRCLLMDEVDRMPASAGTEGDPVNLGIKRTTTFWNRKIVLVSTPGIKGISRIEAAYEDSTMEKYCFECPSCGEYQQIKREHLEHTYQDEKLSKVDAHCEHCGSIHSEIEWKQSKAKWIATKEHANTRGFHLNEYISPWRKWIDIELDFLEAKKSPETLKTFVNTSLGETWEEQGDSVDPNSLITRLEDYGDNLDNVMFKTVGIDIQKDRIELECVGWAADFESYSLNYEIIPGDTTHYDTWDDLQDVLNVINPDAVGIDGGYNTKYVREFVNKNKGFCYELKGDGRHGIDLVEHLKVRRGKLRTARRKGSNTELVGVNQAKSIIYSQLRITEKGAGYCHFPNKPEYDQEYFNQLTGEKLITRFKNGKPVLEWVASRPRVEALDCRVYALATLHLYFQDKKINFESKLLADERPDIVQKRNQEISQRRKSGYWQ